MKRACSICRIRPASFDDEVCPDCARVLYADEDKDEPDRYVDLDAETDDPRHGQADDLNRLR